MFDRVSQVAERDKRQDRQFVGIRGGEYSQVVVTPGFIYRIDLDIGACLNR